MKVTNLYWNILTNRNFKNGFIEWNQWKKKWIKINLSYNARDGHRNVNYFRKIKLLSWHVNTFIRLVGINLFNFFHKILWHINNKEMLQKHAGEATNVEKSS